MSKPFDPVKRDQGLKAVELAYNRVQLRLIYKMYSDEVVREAAKQKAETLPKDGNEPEVAE